MLLGNELSVVNNEILKTVVTFLGLELAALL